MPRNSNLTRRALLAGVATTLAAPALGQSQGAFDQIGPDADPNDLIDKVWDPKREAFITVRELIDQLEQAPIILIGERHGFAPHQDREAFILQALADRGRYPTLALEMLEPAQEPVIEAYRARNPEYARGLGIALDWANTGWPDWSFYEPVFDAAFVAKLPIVGADLPKASKTTIKAQQVSQSAKLSVPFKYWEEVLASFYCGTQTDSEISQQAWLQARRDENMASKLIPENSVLIAGIGHVQGTSSVRAHLDDSTVTLIYSATPQDRETSYVWITEKSTRRTNLC